MKVFNAKFFAGVCIVAVGSFSVFMGLLMVLPPESSVFWGVTLILAGIALTWFGFAVVKDKPPVGSKIEADILRQAKIASKDKDM